MATLDARTYKKRSDAEAHYLGLCDSWASEKRRIDPAQEAIYQRKAQEAAAGGGPLLNAEAEALCIDKAALCDQVKAAEAATQQVWQDIEIKRVKAKADIRKATTAAQMHAIHKILRTE
ncbi:hypothetical protein [Vreelandella populi]|uniref:hypothetical protein n=1 Tax=Vreelandella populi TaxID=2498858 RepID=UPI000F8E431B|nr:hypothetical protein [Halomonas populi]RUR38569.1 hypothetical protein ELY25_09410 [Halomonas populi]